MTGQTAATEARSGSFRRAIRPPTSIDPSRAQETEGIAVTRSLFTGLFQLDQHGQLVPALATSLAHDPAGRWWRFQIRQDTAFSNGEPVTAESFVRGWNRALDPELATETAYHMAGIRGFDEVRAATAPTLAGVRAADRETLLVELSEPDAEFHHKTLQPIFSPVPRCAGRAVDQPGYQARPVGNGPYRFGDEQPPNGTWRLVRNERYFGPPPGIRELLIDIVDSPTAIDLEYAGFEAGHYDFARVPPRQLPAARARYLTDGGFLERDLAGVYYLLPFLGQPPMDSVAARRAVSCAIDRDALTKQIFHGRHTAARSLVPPFFRDVHQPNLGGQYTRFDPDLARTLAAQADLPPEVTVDLAYDQGAGHDGWVPTVARQLHDILGWRVRLLPMSRAQLVEHRTSPRATGLCRAAWLCDYPTPDNLLFPLLHSSCTAPDSRGVAHGDNEGRYANPRYDQLVTEARAAQEYEARGALWQQAEQIAIAEDLALIPLWFGTAHAVYAYHRFGDLDLDFFGNPTVASATLAGAA